MKKGKGTFNCKKNFYVDIKNHLDILMTVKIVFIQILTYLHVLLKTKLSNSCSLLISSPELKAHR